MTDTSGIEREPRDGESWDGAGQVRPVPPHVPPTPETDRAQVDPKMVAVMWLVIVAICALAALLVGGVVP